MTDTQVAAKLKSFKARLGHVEPKPHNVIIGGKVWGRCIIEMDITASFVKSHPKKSSASSRRSV
jgi:hypothetical protein